MKKAISLLLALVMCLSLCACGGGNDAADEKTPKEAVSDRAKSYVELTLTARKYKVARATIPYSAVEEIGENEFKFSGTYTAKDENYGEVKGKFEGTATYDPETKDVEIIDIEID